MTARLLLDAMLGKLLTYLRMCGHDAAYTLERGIEDDDAILALAEAEGRRLLTRDADLARAAEGGILLTSTGIEGQLREVRAAGISLELGDPSRCSRCNGELEALSSGASTPEDVPVPGAEEVWRCRICSQHYWRGSHWDDVRERLSRL